MKERIPDIKKFMMLYILLPVVLDLVIESLNRKSLFKGVAYMVDKPSVFIFNVLIIMLTLTIAMFFQREIFVFSVIAIVWLLFGIANYIILHFRVTPFSAVDFTLISSAISVSGHYFSKLNIAMMVLAVVMLLIAVVCLFKKAPRNTEKVGKRRYVMSGSIVLCLGIMILFMQRSSASVQALSSNYTNISDAYENYGFVYCFTNSILDTGISKPADYSEESVNQVIDQLKPEENTKDHPNIIMIQLESFFDVDYVKGLKFSEDPLPVFHGLQKHYSNGLLTVPTVGAGTVNTEFEVLTGMRQHDFGVSEYPYKTIMKSETAESISNDLAKLDYTSHVVHNNTATFYGRNKVFSNMGFDSFTSIEYMNNVILNPNGWANDNIMTNQIMSTLNATKGSDFTFGITVQSHGKYDGINLEQDQPIKVTGAPEGKEDAYSYYVNEIHEVDQMIGALIEKLSARDEHSVLVLYGDHLPSLDLTEDNLSNGDLYQTEYVIWDNYGLNEQDKDLNSYQLYATVLDQIGIHEGNITRYHQQSDWNKDSYLEGLQILEYDQLYGENYAYHGEKPFEASDLQMGTEKIRVKDVVETENTEDEKETFKVSGSGFTPYCKVLFNGKEMQTEWISSDELQVTGHLKFGENDSFQVEVQNGDGILLSASNLLMRKNTQIKEFQ